MLERFFLSACIYTAIGLFMRRELRGAGGKTKAVYIGILIMSLYSAVKYILLSSWPGLIELMWLLFGGVANAADRLFGLK